MKKLYFSWSK